MTVTIKIQIIKNIDGQEYSTNHIDKFSVDEFDQLISDNQYLSNVNNGLEEAINYVNNESDGGHN